MCRDQNKAAPGSYRQPVGQADSGVDGAEPSGTEHRVQSVHLLEWLLLRFGYKTQENIRMNQIVQTLRSVAPECVTPHIQCVFSRGPNPTQRPADTGFEGLHIQVQH